MKKSLLELFVISSICAVNSISFLFKSSLIVFKNHCAFAQSEFFSSLKYVNGSNTVFLKSFVPYCKNNNSSIKSFSKKDEANNLLFGTSAYDDIDGLLYDLDSYVLDVYPSWSLIEKKYLKNYHPISQFDTSVYLEEHDYRSSFDTFCSEGNCVINSTFSMLRNLPIVKTDNGYCYNYNTNFLNGIVPLDYSSLVQNDPFYYGHGLHNYYGTFYDSKRDDFYDSYSITNDSDSLSILPTMYMQLREVAIDCGYVTNGMLFAYAKTMVESVDSLYSYSIELNLNSTIETVVSNINYGIPSLISTTNSLTFGNHAMAVYGYAKYSYETIAFGFPITLYTYFWMVDSGWEILNDPLYYDEYGNRIDWFDPNRCDSVAFATLNRNTLTIPSGGGGGGGFPGGGGGHGNLINPTPNP